MNWFLIAEIAYALILIAVMLRVIYDSSNVTKTLAYLILIIFLPVGGMLLYFAVGINYRRRKLYSRKIIVDDVLARDLPKDVGRYSTGGTNEADMKKDIGLANLLLAESSSPLTCGNKVELHVNGEQKFPAVLHAIKNAKHHIHLEYYIIETDSTGWSVANELIKKAGEGLKIRIIYDAYGSRKMSNEYVHALEKAGIEIYPFYKIYFPIFTNRLNFRNHRKIIIIDGKLAFLGGINISRRYVNSPDNSSGTYWRDTHLQINGPGVKYLQYLFLCDWNFCSDQSLQPDQELFPPFQEPHANGGSMVQIAASGPDSNAPSILFSILKAIHLAKKEILITTPYFIPGESLFNAMLIASYSGIRIRLLVPGITDSKVVKYASRSFYRDLLEAGVEIYEYKKGFIHAKTLIIDNRVAMVGTANMDLRSFDLNFEVNAILYDRTLAMQLSDIFKEDLKEAEKIELKRWIRRPVYQKFFEKTASLFSPLL